jgi:hypothetical protein
MGSAAYPHVLKAQTYSSPLRASTRSSIEPVSSPTAVPLSSFVPPATGVKQEIQNNIFGHPVPPVPSDKIQPYGGYLPLVGSSRLGRAATESPPAAPAPAPALASFGSPAPQSGMAAFSASPAAYGNSNRALSLPTGAGGAPLPGISATLATHGLYDLAVSTPPSTSASISSSSSSPQNGFQPSNDFGTSAGGGGVPDMNWMEMEFGGYGVPTADKEAILRQFAPALLQDGQIGVDRDTMMMWSTMPSTYECVLPPLLYFVSKLTWCGVP